MSWFIKDVKQEANKDLSIEELANLENGILPEIDFSSVFTEKYSYLFD